MRLNSNSRHGTKRCSTFFSVTIHRSASSTIPPLTTMDTLSNAQHGLPSPAKTTNVSTSYVLKKHTQYSKSKNSVKKSATTPIPPFKKVHTMLSHLEQQLINEVSAITFYDNQIKDLVYSNDPDYTMTSHTSPNGKEHNVTLTTDLTLSNDEYTKLINFLASREEAQNTAESTVNKYLTQKIQQHTKEQA